MATSSWYFFIVVFLDHFPVFHIYIVYGNMYITMAYIFFKKPYSPNFQFVILFSHNDSKLHCFYFPPSAALSLCWARITA